MKIPILPQIEQVLALLNKSDFEAYVVGGCVRDCLLGRVPEDWDVTTDATPDEMKLCFSGFRVVETGIKYGTLTVLLDGMPVEITTYRIDGAYSDHRRPDGVEFTRDLKSDLSRRDFTMNALAYHPAKGIIDYFGGQNDLDARRIVCVGDAEARFSQDALRIMRAVRFASTLGFSVEERTESAMNKLTASLRDISAERVAAELNKAVTGEYISDALLRYTGVFSSIIPELTPMVGFEQHTKYHHLDVWKHTVETVKAIPNDLILRLTMLLHDAGKPKTFTLDEHGVGHFYGHAEEGAVISGRVLDRLRYDNATRKQVAYLIKHHCDFISPETKAVKRLLNRMGEENLRYLIAIKRADCAGQASEFRARREQNLMEIESKLEAIVKQNQAFALKDLAINGDDLREIGFTPGKRLGDTLDKLLQLVIDETLENERDELISAARTMLE